MLTADASFTAFGLCVAASPDGPRLNLTLGTDTQELAFAGEGPQCRRIVPGAATDSARLELVGGEAIITGWWLERPSGVVVSNLGVPGSQLQFLGRADEATIAAQFQALPADLVILAFGTNEGFAPFFDSTRLESQIREQVARIRRLAGPVPILLLGPPDAASRNRELRDNVVGGAPGGATDCNSAIQATPDRLPVDGIDIPTTRLDELTGDGAMPKPGAQVEIPSTAIYDPGNYTISFLPQEGAPITTLTQGIHTAVVRYWKVEDGKNKARSFSWEFQAD